MSTAIRRCDYVCWECTHPTYLMGRDFPDVYQGWCSQCQAYCDFVREER